MALIGVLLVIELRAISKDRTDGEARAKADHNQEELSFKHVREAQQTSFTATAQGLSDAYDQSQKQFAATMRKEDGVMQTTRSAANSAQDAVASLTGGTSYLLVTPFEMSPGVFRLMLTVHGKYTIWDASLDGADMTDSQFPGRGKDNFFLQLGAVSPTYARPIEEYIKPDPSKVNTYTYWLYSRQDPELETMNMRFDTA